MRKPTRALSESGVLRVLLLAASDLGVRLFRNNVGKLQDRYGTWVAYGLHPGSPDLVGWRTITVTPEMVGQRLAVFVGIEVKRENGGRVSDAQQRFMNALQEAGALAGVCRSVADLAEVLSPTSRASVSTSTASCAVDTPATTE